MSFLGRVSRWLNYALGGRKEQTLCARMAERHGFDCAFCRLIGAILRQPDHCWQEMLAEFKRRAGK